MRCRLAAILVLTSSLGHAAQETCISCDEPIRSTVYMASSPYFESRKPVCSDCAENAKACFTCRLPARKNLDLKDGRILCLRDAKTAVLSGEQAKMMFEEVKRDMIIMLRGAQVFPQQNVSFDLVDAHELESLSRVKRFPTTHSALLGITRTRGKQDRYEHEIRVLAGMTPNKFLGVCAHEYGHAWLNENVAVGRELDSDTVEGFCELLAYKLIVDKGDAIEKKLLLDNDYTRGQIDVLIKAEDAYNFYYVTRWIINGEDSTLQPSKIERLLVVRSSAGFGDAPFAWPPPTAVRAMAPTNFVLKNISGTAKRKFAMINGATLGPNESAKVPLGSTNISVRCLDIKDASVMIQVSGESEPQELFLPAKGNASAR
ncbi:MAG TPA: hypothetical protein VJ063_03050 [Verrucomicrobiae bacterium]|nr:hypothetical protein [Verrucomicrobiae bacterium]